MNRITNLFRVIIGIPMFILMVIAVLMLQEDCQVHAQNKIKIPFSASADPADLAYWRFRLSLHKLWEGTFINDENYSGVGGCHCVTHLEFDGEYPIFTKTAAIGYLYLTAIDETPAIEWDASARIVEVRVNAPDGDLFARTPATSWKLGPWAVTGTRLFLQDVSGGKPLVAENTLAVLAIE